MESTTFVFGTWLKMLRKQLGLSRQAVANRAGGELSQQYLHFMETGRATNIGSQKLKALAQGLGVPLEVLRMALDEGRAPAIAMLGHVSGGAGAHLAGEEYTGEVMPYLSSHESSELFAVEIIGDSMAPRLEHTDIALVRPWRPEDGVASGGVYLLRHQGKVTCKYLVRDRDDPQTVWIKAEQPHLFADCPLTSGYTVLGRVIEVRKTASLMVAFGKSPADLVGQ